ncbi:MAG TPA: thioredoxin domain-containing protein, partial [Kineosporiaceae bacterium]|nr:thioredoxin domain-containing protein [Kineosporiaceae bacterium]
NAMASVINASPASFQAFHTALFDNQPAENTAGLPDATLVDLAVKAGAPKAAVEAPITGVKFRGWTLKVTQDFTKTYTGTPTVLINGTQAKDLTPTVLQAAIDKAIAG